MVFISFVGTVRGEIWLRLAGVSTDDGMMDTYRTLMTKECPNEDIIQRDITRTFPANDYFRESGGAGQDQLYKISKGYAVYDTEVGYCQGISFIAAALLLQVQHLKIEEFSKTVLISFNFSLVFCLTDARGARVLSLGQDHV